MAIHSFFKGNAMGRVLYLVDNSPSDILSVLANLYPNQIVYCHNNKNLGYGAAHNIAIRESLRKGFTYHVVLNPDVEFNEETLIGLEAFMDRNPDVGLCMPDIRDYDKGYRLGCSRLLPTPFHMFLRRFATTSNYTRRKDEKLYLKFADFSKVLDVPSLSGCFMFLRNKHLRDVGLFDERFFMYYEDVDLSRRMFCRHRNCYVPTVFAKHISERAQYHSNKMLWIMIKSAIRYFNKYGWMFDREREDINKRVIETLPKR